MFVSNEKFDSDEKDIVYNIYNGSMYDYNQKDAFSHKKPKPWDIVEGPFSNRYEAICRMQAIYLKTEAKKKEIEESRKRLLDLYYKEDDSSICSFYICHKCKVIYWHSLLHCPFCPDRMMQFKGTRHEAREFIKEYQLGH